VIINGFILCIKNRRRINRQNQELRMRTAPSTCNYQATFPATVHFLMWHNDGRGWSSTRLGRTMNLHKLSTGTENIFSRQRRSLSCSYNQRRNITKGVVWSKQQGFPCRSYRSSTKALARNKLLLERLASPIKSINEPLGCDNSQAP
jgi:hypothetical protein